MPKDPPITFDLVRYYQFLLMHFARFEAEAVQADLIARIPVIRRVRRNYNVLKIALEATTKTGPVFEFGVYQGRTINFMARMLPNEQLYGFDSFEGFPNDGRKDWKTDFSVEQLPKVTNNVTLVKGFFENTLPVFLEENANLASPRFLHVDCDIYSSTRTILQVLGSRLSAGTVISFDELLHYSGFRQNEFLALFEFIEASGMTFRWVARAGKLMPLSDFLELRSKGALPRRMRRMRSQGYHQYAAIVLEQRNADYENDMKAFEEEAQDLASRFPFKHPDPGLLKVDG